MLQLDLAEPFIQTGWFPFLLRFWPVLCIAFFVSLFATPVLRFVARKTGVVDRPDEARKLHTKPIAYLGGVAVFVSIVAGVIASYFLVKVPMVYQPFPVVVLVGMCAIGLTGLADDIFEYFDPWWKVAGQLVAAAAMAQQGVGTRVAEGFMRGVLGISESICNYPLVEAGAFMPDPITLTMITGVIIIVIFVLGACNAANLLDGLDGLLSGVVAITCIGFIAISVLIAMNMTPEDLQNIAKRLPKNLFLSNRGESITLIGANIVLGLSVLGAVLGFLVYNFNPASIFLGDAGSLLLGYLCIVMVLMLGESGQTYIVVAGLIVFALPILDTLLAIIRRKMAGKPMSEPDSNHIHHIIKRTLHSVKLTVLSLYGISMIFCMLGVALVYAHITESIRAWVIYLVATIIFGGISLLALHAARRHEIG
ncbi:MAG: undecaprenyl/decaprenyl-phosphate alpha-N-acetylglucosaminyl 1-phosphate transferase [Planctomycetes bacterium]|nr:undecaprenyl/decaprenyl-phosphate alpha-N-acetylglucosaminyl 1-phosphate transferase [Planctomycetota bacterium]